MDEGTFHGFGMGESSSPKFGEVFLIKGGGGSDRFRIIWGGGGGWVKRDEVNFLGGADTLEDTMRRVHSRK